MKTKELEALDNIKVSLAEYKEYAIDVLPTKAKQIREENDDDFIIVEDALKDLAELDYKQNTIDDFYESTEAMINDLLELVYTKMVDNLKEGRIYTKTGILETLSFAIRYVKTFAHGDDFQGRH